MDNEEIKQRKIEELQNQNEQLVQIDELESIIKTKLSKEALSRIGNIKTVYPEKYLQLLSILSHLIQKTNVIDDSMVKDILLKLQQKKEFKITRK